MPLTHRERVRAATIAEIKEIARRHMAEKGAAALSLRAIAREIGMTSPALYRYFSSRDDLVTALIVDAYNSLADALETACASCPSDAFGQCLFNVSWAYRDWAIAQPQDYALIFGVPIPGYTASEEVTKPPAIRAMRVFLSLLTAAEQAGKLNPSPAYANPPAALQAKLEKWQEKIESDTSFPVMYLALAGWARLHGLILLEIFHHLDPLIGGGNDLYRAEALALVEQSGLMEKIE